MASRRIQFITAAAVAVLGASGYLLYSALASPVREGSVLAQAPLNSQVQVKPAFIMAVDNSGSMKFHTQFPGTEGEACWDTNSSRRSFFNADGSFITREQTLNSAGNVQSRYKCGYLYVTPGGTAGAWQVFGGGNGINIGFGIPPVDSFGFARSAALNPAYFDPEIDYSPWLNGDGTPYGSTAANPEGNASLTATRIDPRETDTVNLTAWRDTEGFTVRQGMRFPVNTVYQHVNNCGLPTTNRQHISGSWYRVTSTNWVVGSNSNTCENNVRIRYRLATFYMPAGSDVPSPADDPGAFDHVSSTTVNNACGNGCNMVRYDISDAPNNAAALQRFANWYSFYGNRYRAMVAGMTHSFADVNNLRAGYFTIHPRTGDVEMFDMGVPTQRERFYDEKLLTLVADGSGTPNLDAVSYMGNQFARPRSGSDPNPPIQLACQRNAGMLFTDGFSNTDFSAPAVTGLEPPFSPTPANSMAAIASQFYYGDPYSDLVGLPEGEVPVPASCSDGDDPDPRLNCQSNLHMNFYGITLGARGEIFDPELEQDPFTMSPAPAWPGHVSNTRNTIDDIWHATINTRGEFINARTPAGITAALRRVLSAVSFGASPSGAIALSGARVGNNSLTVIPSYRVGDVSGDSDDDESDGTDWHGELEALQMILNPTTGALEEGSASWKASERIQSHQVRRNHVYFGRGNAVHPFNEAHVNFADLCTKPGGLYPSMSLCTGATLQAMGFSMTQVIDYLLGDASNEGVGSGSLRARTTKLGDIVNSTPVVSSSTDDYGYRTLRESNYATTYADYLTAKSGRDPMVYVGANDGMLHAFNGSMNASGGREVFAYIPTTALGHMGNLLIPNDPLDQNDQKFQHRYFVDGPITVSDANVGSGANNGWRTVLVGTAGAGGRSVFGLDVSNPSQFNRLWEISDLNTSLAADVRNNIGHVLGRPVIVPVRHTQANSSRWVAIFGNGYKSASGNAVLFVVDIGTGQVQMLEAAQDPNYPGSSADENGLGNIVVVDRYGGVGDDLDLPVRDGFADTVYAADLQGAIWKFDLRDLIPGAQTPSGPDSPLFATQTYVDPASGQTHRQPITGGMTAALGARGGVMLYFGTGSFSFDGDQYDTSPQTLYAVNDIDNGAVSSTLTSSNLTAISLRADRTIDMADAVAPALSSGWYINLPRGERFVAYPNIVGGTVFMPTYVPDPDATGCAGSGSNWLFGLNARTGAAGMSSVFSSPDDPAAAHPQDTAAIALDTEGTAPVRDVGVFTLPRPTAGEPDPNAPTPPPDAPERSCWMAVMVAGADPMHLPYPCGRQSWRQIQ